MILRAQTILLNSTIEKIKDVELYVGSNDTKRALFGRSASREKMKYWRLIIKGGFPCLDINNSALETA